MASKKNETRILSQPPALTPEGQENQLISLAMDRAREQLEAGTASSQIIVHFLRQGTMKNDLEKEKLRRENELLVAKVEALQSQQRTEELFAEAIKAMRLYSGTEDDHYDEDV